MPNGYSLPFDERDMSDKRFFQFENRDMQTALAAELRLRQVPHRLDEGGCVHYARQDEETFGEAACAVRDGFAARWHVCTWEEAPDTQRFHESLVARQIPFVVERTDWAIWFLLREEDRSACEAASDRLWSDALNAECQTHFAPSCA